MSRERVMSTEGLNVDLREAAEDPGWCPECDECHRRGERFIYICPFHKGFQHAAELASEAIRERDEAIALLRKVTGTLEWALEYDKDDFGDRGFLHEEFPEEFRDAVEEASAARSFLARFPEGGEG